jgi:hypothetical protein
MAKKKPQELPGPQKAWGTTVAMLAATELLKRLIDWAVELLKHWW